MSTCKERGRRRVNSDIETYVDRSFSWAPSDQKGPYVTDSDIEVMTDTVCSDYRIRLARGDIVNHPCSYVHEQIREGSGAESDTHIASGNWNHYTGPITSYWADFSPESDFCVSFDTSSYARDEVNAADEAKLVSLSNLDSTPYAFGEDLGELRQTYRFMRNPLRSIFNLSKLFKSKRDAGKSLADVWLSYRFAFRPLVRSGQDAMDAWLVGPRKRPKRLVSRGFKTVSFAESNSKVTGDLEGVSWSWSGDLDIETKYHAGCLYGVSNPCDPWQYTLGLRGKDIPYTAWQLFPYSFMVDRLLDFSTFAQAATNMLDPNLSIYTGWLVQRRRSVNTYRIDGRTYPGYNISISAGDRQKEIFNYRRNGWVPSLSDVYVRFDRTGLIKDSTRIVDLVSLILKNLR